MENTLAYLLPVLILSAACAGWFGIQLMARKMNTKNHIDGGGGCCGACEKDRNCTNSLTLGEKGSGG